MRECLVCSAQFTPRAAGKPQVYCGRPCYEASRRARDKARVNRTYDPGHKFTCGWCDEPLPYSGRGRPPKFCNSSCKQRAGYRDNPEQKKRHNQEFRDRNPDYHAERQATWRQENPDKNKEVQERYYRKNAHNWDKYRSKRAGYIRPEDANYTTWAKVQARFTMWAGKCWICGADATARDHVKPLAKGGRHLPANIRPICTPCNSRKGDRWPIDLYDLRRRAVPPGLPVTVLLDRAREIIDRYGNLPVEVTGQGDTNG